MQKQAKITSKGQITIPNEVRRILGVRSGDRLVFESDDAGVRVRAVRARSQFSKYRSIGNPVIGSGKENIARWLRELRGDLD
jgi:AbrB family looped-hinge helix DNA binding protein